MTDKATTHSGTSKSTTGLIKSRHLSKSQNGQHQFSSGCSPPMRSRRNTRVSAEFLHINILGPSHCRWPGLAIKTPQYDASYDAFGIYTVRGDVQVRSLWGLVSGRSSVWSCQCRIPCADGRGTDYADTGQDCKSASRSAHHVLDLQR